MAANPTITKLRSSDTSSHRVSPLRRTDATCRFCNTSAKQRRSNSSRSWALLARLACYCCGPIPRRRPVGDLKDALAIGNHPPFPVPPMPRQLPPKSTSQASGAIDSDSPPPPSHSPNARNINTRHCSPRADAWEVAKWRASRPFRQESSHWMVPSPSICLAPTTRSMRFTSTRPITWFRTSVCETSSRH